MRRVVKAVGLFPLVIQGCATAPVGQEAIQAWGHFASVRGRPGLVIGAPHGTSDIRTGQIGHALANRIGFGLVTAEGFNDLGPRRRRFHVNRPTEGIPGRPPSEEVYTDEARLVYERYVGLVREVSQGPLRLYVELHGNTRRESAERIEIATVGVTPLEASKLKTLFELIRDVHVRSNPEIPRLDVLVEPLDRIVLSASASKKVGILCLSERALHIELPRAPRAPEGQPYVDVLAEFLTEASRVLSEPR
ncbi:MAG: hypothetical protein ACE5JD_11865 [Candidatus Methylomirabilia bacterium]